MGRSTTTRTRARPNTVELPVSLMWARVWMVPPRLTVRNDHETVVSDRKFGSEPAGWLALGVELEPAVAAASGALPGGSS